MRLNTLGAIDQFVTGTAAVYSEPALNAALARAPRQAFQVTCDDVDGTSPTMTLSVEGSNDGDNWDPVSTPVDGETLSSTLSNVFRFTEDGGTPLKEFMRLKVELGGTDPRAHVRVSSCQRSALGGWSPAGFVSKYGGAWLDSRKHLVVTSDPDIDEWLMRKGSLGSFDQATGSKKPHVASVNGVQVVEFDGSASQNLQSNANLADWKFMHEAAGATIFVKARYTGGSGVQRLFCNSNGGSASAIGVSLDMNATNGQASAFVCNGSGTWVAYCYRTAALTQDEYALYELRWSQSFGFDFRINGGTPHTGSASGTPSSANPTAVPRLGSHSGGAVQFLTGDIQHVFAVPGVLPDAEAAKARNYFQR